MAYVYVVKARDMDIYKIGIAMSPDARLDALRTGSPVPLDLLRSVHCDDARWAERFLHSQLDQYRSHGEWFCLDDKQMDVLHHLLDVISDWRPKPSLVSLMVRNGFPMNDAIAQVYGEDRAELVVEDRKEIRDRNSVKDDGNKCLGSEERAELILNYGEQGWSTHKIIRVVFGVTGGRLYRDAQANVNQILGREI